ncbi:MAG: fimbrial biogenesis outer membrane usher protein [Candidatus Delongbacteria bacterium]|nr:fimbrial biogenesis outer membrane usher protein [Candidatus Delongbacteria bacterium]
MLSLRKDKLKTIARSIILILLVTMQVTFANKKYFASSDPNLNDTDYDTLFKKVFGYEEKKPFKLLVPFYINDQKVGKIEVFLKKSGGQIHVRKNVLLNELKEYLDRKSLENLVSKTLKESTVSLSFLLENRIVSNYDENDLEFKLIIPPDLRKVNVTKYGNDGAPKNVEFAVRPDIVSSFLNIRSSQIVKNNIETEEFERYPFSLHLDGALNINGLVLESVGDFSEGDTYKIGKTCIVYDQPDRMLRYYLGDLNIPITGYQTSPSIGGISITKEFNLQPYSSTKPISMNEIIIYRTSNIEIYSNDILVEKIKVDPGPFNLRQISYQHGINEVRLKIENDLGEIQEINIDSFCNGQQLQEGLNQYSFNLGFASYYGDNMYEYDQKDPVLSMFFRRGFNNKITLGSYAQVKLDQMLFGVGSNFSTGLGNFNTDVAISKTDSVSIDYACKLSYDYYNNSLNKNPYRRKWKASFEYKGNQFSNLNVLIPDNNINYILTGFVSQDITRSINSALSTSYGFNELSNSDFYSYSLSMSKIFSSSFKISCSVSNFKAIGEKNDWRASLNFIFKPKTGNVLNSTYNSTDNRSSLSWYYNSTNNKFRNDITSNYSEINKITVSEKASYSGNRGDISLNYRFENTFEGSIDNEINMSANTALVFVNGKFGWCKPVRNSFAIVRTNSVLEGHRVGIQRYGKGLYQYSSDLFGPAVYSSLTPYKVHQFDIELPDIPVGYEANAGEQILLPTYKSGFLIDIEAKPYVFARGRLVDKDNRPLENVTARVVPFGKSQEEEKDIFTNKGGYFFINGLNPGSYTIEFDSDKYQSIKIKILKENKHGYSQLGSLEVNENKKFKYNYLKK